MPLVKLSDMVFPLMNIKIHALVVLEKPRNNSLSNRRDSLIEIKFFKSCKKMCRKIHYCCATSKNNEVNLFKNKTNRIKPYVFYGYTR